MKRSELSQTTKKRKKSRVRFEGGEDPFEYDYDFNSYLDLHLPKVLIMLADNVRLIRNNSVPMLQA